MQKYLHVYFRIDFDKTRYFDKSYEFNEFAKIANFCGLEKVNFHFG